MVLVENADVFFLSFLKTKALKKTKRHFRFRLFPNPIWFPGFCNRLASKYSRSVPKVKPYAVS